MSMLKWTMESAWAAAAVLITTTGGVYTTVYHSGQTNQQISEMRTDIAATDAHVAKHDDQLDTIKQQNAAMQQSLNDIKDTVHDIQTQVRKPQHGDHN
jgi:septal ring factor EnvC (AmiA/AmiB activator)